MAKILLQSTVQRGADQWHIGRFSGLCALLRETGHDVEARDREPASDGSDPILSSVLDRGFDQVWLFALDHGNGLGPGDVRALLRFREQGGGMLTARDHQDVGCSLLNLGTLGAINHFHSYNRAGNRAGTYGAADELQTAPPVPRSDWEKAYATVTATVPLHDVMRTQRSPSGAIEHFPPHPHEGAISVPEGAGFARVVATGTNLATGRRYNVAVAVDGEPGMAGRPCGRALAVATFHHFTDTYWDVDPILLEPFKDYVRNIARWLGKRSS